MERMDRMQYYMAMAELAAKRSPCERRQIGAIAVKNDRVIATGYNGPPSGMEHCTKSTCVRMLNNIPSGTQLEHCRAIHAEANLLVQCATSGSNMHGATVYCTHTPCTSCVKLLLGVKIERLLCKEWYPDDYTKELLALAGMIRIRRDTDDFIEYIHHPFAQNVFTGVSVAYSNGDRWISENYNPGYRDYTVPAMIMSGPDIAFSNNSNDTVYAVAVDIYQNGSFQKRFDISTDGMNMTWEDIRDAVLNIFGPDDFQYASIITKGHTRLAGGTYESIPQAITRVKE